MALELNYIGPVGIQKTRQGKFWFTNAQRQCSQLTQTYTVPMGNYLVAWRGTLKQGTDSGTIFTNEDSLQINQANSGTCRVGGMTQLYGVTTIHFHGSGKAAFTEDPEVIFVRFG